MSSKPRDRGKQRFIHRKLGDNSLFGISRWVSFESASETLRKWLAETELQHPPEMQLRATLDEKRAQLTTYRTLLQDVLAHQQAILDCRDRAQILPESGFKDDRGKVDEFIESASKKHQVLLKRAQMFVERYEGIVSDHQQYRYNKSLPHHF